MPAWGLLIESLLEYGRRFGMLLDPPYAAIGTAVTKNFTRVNLNRVTSFAHGSGAK